MAHRQTRPYWSQVLRSLREARGITQDGWAMQVGYGRATVRRWETGESVPSAHAESRILELCRERALFRHYADGPLAGIQVTPEWLSDLLASARLDNVQWQSLSPPEPPPTLAKTQYASSGDVAIAFQVFGSGPIDVVVTPGLVSHRELEWEHPGFVQFFERLASFARVIIFDKRGTGMSDRVAAGTLEERIDDIRAVMDAAGSRRAALLGVSEGGPMSILFAATYPDRTQALILYGAFASEWDPEEYPFGAPRPLLPERLERVRHVWGTVTANFLRIYAPSVADDPAEQEWWARYQRISASPGAAVALITMNSEIDVRHVLPAIRVPTMVLHRKGDRAVEIDHGLYLARHISGARYVELDGIDHLPMYGDVQQMIDEVKAFLDTVETVPEVDSVLATVLAANVAGASRDDGIVEQYRAIVRRELTRFRGREINTDSAQFLASFDGPTRAVRCACSISNALRSLGLNVHSGLHTGEIQIYGDDVSGGALDTSARIAQMAQPGEVLVSSTVTDLIPGSGFEFAARGAHCVDETAGNRLLFTVHAETERP